MNKNRNLSIFQKHVNNTLEQVNGQHLNKIQEAINNAENNVNEVCSKEFFSNCSFILENNPNVNSMLYIDFATLDAISKTDSSNYIHNPNEKCLYSSQPTGVVHTIGFNTPYDSSMNKFILKADAYVPQGSTIKFYLSYDKVSYFPIKTQDGNPFSLDTWKDTVYVKIELIKNKSGQSPKIYAVCLFYVNKALEVMNNITGVIPELTPEVENNYLDTTLVRENGVLKRILQSDGTIINLNYIEGKVTEIVETTLDKRTEYTLNFNQDGELQSINQESTAL